MAKPSKSSKPAKPTKAVKPAKEKETPKVPKLSKLPKDELKKFKDALLHLREVLTGDVKALETEALKESEQDFSVDHMADHGSDNFDQEFNLGLIENAEETVREINDAIERINESTFGICEGCERPIAKPRLQAIPYARFCVDCQRTAERRQETA